MSADPGPVYTPRQERNGLVDERIARLMEAWDFSQFSDIDIPPVVKQILYEGLAGIHEHFYSKPDPTVFVYDLTKAPPGDLQLLTAGMTRRIGEVSSPTSALLQGVIAWAPVARRDTSEEIKLGHISPPRHKL